MAPKKSRQEREKNWEAVQIKAFTAWVNSYLDRKGRGVQDLTTDLCDGVRLNEFLEMLTGRTLKFEKEPSLKVQKIENLAQALNFITKDLGVRLIGIGAEDLIDGNLKLILGLLWSLFRKVRISAMGGEGDAKGSEESSVLKWVREMTEGYPNVHIHAFKDSFNDGLALAALIHKFNSDYIDFFSMDPKEKEANVTKAMEIAEEKLGIPKLLDVTEVVEGSCDERSFTLYLSLMNHAFETQADKMKMENEKRSVTDQLKQLRDELDEEHKAKLELERLSDELEAKLAEKSDEAARLRSELDDLKHKYADLNDEKNRLADELADLRQTTSAEIDRLTRHRDKLSSELEELHRKVAEERERLGGEKGTLLNDLDELKKTLSDEREKNSENTAFLEEKVNVLSQLIEEHEEEKLEATEEAARLKEQLERERREKKQLKEKAEKAAKESQDIASKLEDAEQRRTRMTKEVDQLKKKVAKEMERRKAKSKAMLDLQKEVQGLRKKAIVDGKARNGLDVLKMNLQEHLEDLYHWRDLHEMDLEDDNKLPFDLNAVVKELSTKRFEEQLEFLGTRLKEENTNLERILKLSDSQYEMKQTVEKEGWLHMKANKKVKDWRKQWFVLRGSNLLYYKDQKDDKVQGQLSLMDCQMIALKAEKNEDEKSPIKKFFIVKIGQGDKSIYLGFTSLKEKASWMLPLRSKNAHFAYLSAAEAAKHRPDTRILSTLQCKELKTIHLEGLALPAAAVEALVAVIPLHETLETISLADSNLGDLVKPLIDAFSKTKLRSVNLAKNQINSENAGALIKALVTNEGLQEIHLQTNNLDKEVVPTLIEEIPKLEKLKTLDLSENKLSDSGTSKLVEGLQSTNLGLSALQLSGNGIGDAGAAAIATFISKNKTVSKIVLRDNKISDEGAIALANALKENDLIDEIDLANNRIGNKGAMALRKSLKSHKSMLSVNLSGNKLAGGSELNEFFVEGYSFPELSLQRI